MKANIKTYSPDANYNQTRPDSHILDSKKMKENIKTYSPDANYIQKRPDSQTLDIKKTESNVWLDNLFVIIHLIIVYLGIQLDNVAHKIKTNMQEIKEKFKIIKIRSSLGYEVKTVQIIGYLHKLNEKSKRNKNTMNKIKLIERIKKRNKINQNNQNYMKSKIKSDLEAKIPTEIKEYVDDNKVYNLSQLFSQDFSVKSKLISLVSNYKLNRDTISPIIGNFKPNMLIDSGADVSLIKEEFVQSDKINKTDKLSLSGIGQGETITIGSIKTEIKFTKDFSIKHKLYVVPDTFSVEENGIIGRDFFDKYKVDILYSTNQLKIGNRFIDFENKKQNIIKLPARSETVVEIQTISNQASICTAMTIKTGVFLPHMIIQPVNFKAKILIANTLNEETELENFQMNIEEIPKLPEHEEIISMNIDREEQIVQSITENLDTENNVEENMSILSLCLEYQDIFYLEGDKLTSIKGVRHDINLYTDSKPVHVQRYRLPQIHRDEINKQVKEMIEEGKIQTSTSPFSSSLLVVPKKADKDGKPKWRVVVDFRKLNEITIGDSFPLPNINDILDQLGHAQYFSTLDMASGYHQIEMNPNDSHKTAFSTDYGHFEFTRMPFGLKNSQATFQRAINHILRGFQGIKGFVYLDDVIIYGKNLKDHNNKLVEVFELCRRNNLKLQSTKCQFLKKEVKFLGHIITPAGIKPNPITVQAVQDFPTPKNIREIQSFLGLANYYRRFIPRFSENAEPLVKLTRKGTQFIFSEDCEKSFNSLKQSLISPPVLKYPDTTRPFILTTDASDYSLGAVLAQNYPSGEFPIAYASRALGKSERNYSTIEKEMLAIYWAVNNFRPYLYGKKFTIITDHKPLTGNLTKIPNRIVKWNLKLSEYNFEIIHKPGKLNTNADALSRIKHKEIVVITRAQTKNSQNKSKITNDEQVEVDEIPTEDSKSPSNNTAQKQVPKIEIVTDIRKRQQILNEYHNLPLGGHAGTWRTFKRIKMLYYWPRMLVDINRFIRKCQLCKRNKCHRKTKVPLQITTTSDYPFQRVAFDIVGPLPTTEKFNNYLLTFQDDLSKFSGAIPIPNQNADTVAKALCEQYITKYGIPEKILTDQGSNFMSKTFNEICKLLKLKHITTTAYHPETNGALEKSHNTLKEYLRTFTDIDKNNWDEMCHYAIFVYNTTPHCSTNYTPHELVYGRPALIPSSIKKEPEPIYNYDDYVSELKARLRLAHAIARNNIMKKKLVTKQNYDKKLNLINLQPNDFVWLKNEARRTKQDALWLGPYKVITINSPTNTTILIKNRLVKVHNNRLIKQSD